jgi:hypothetical protein
MVALALKGVGLAESTTSKPSDELPGSRGVPWITPDGDRDKPSGMVPAVKCHA